MSQLNLHAINPCQPLGHAVGEVHGAVLTSRAAEGDLKVVAAGVQFCQCGNAASSNVANCHFLLWQSALVREGCDGYFHALPLKVYHNSPPHAQQLRKSRAFAHGVQKIHQKRHK